MDRQRRGGGWGWELPKKVKVMTDGQSKGWCIDFCPRLGKQTNTTHRQIAAQRSYWSLDSRELRANSVGSGSLIMAIHAVGCA